MFVNLSKINFTGNVGRKNSSRSDRSRNVALPDNTRLQNSLECLAACNKKVSCDFFDRRFSESTNKTINNLRRYDYQRYVVLINFVKNLKIDKKVSNKAKDDLINEVINLKDDVLLRFALDEGVEFKLLKGSKNACFSKNSCPKTIKFYEHNNGKNNTISLSHELGHVLDHNTSKKYLSKYTFDSICINVDSPKEKNGKHVELLSNFLLRDKNDKNAEIDILKADFSFNFLVSMSIEYNDALKKDISIMEEKAKNNMSESEYNRIEYGLGGNENKFYLGFDKKEKKFNYSRMQRELFAQLCAIATNNYTSKSKFSDDALVGCFKNTYAFVRNVIEHERSRLEPLKLA